tara:strand:+ start:1497 stop:3746 length:2250 start_codon:yes stop_codon:yes gene_type:complete
MNSYIERDNLIVGDAEVPDKLRGELGGYLRLSEDTGQFVMTSYESGKIASSTVSESTRNDRVMFPKDSHIINFYGHEPEFRDSLQWKLFVEDICKVNKRYEDHYFLLNEHESTSGLISGTHNPVYEDATKVYDTNLLLNYNLADYAYNNDSDKIRLFSSLRSREDSEENKDAPNGDSDISRILQEYSRRIDTFDGDLSSLDRGQRFIFKLSKIKHGLDINQWPCHFKVNVNPLNNLKEDLVVAMNDTNNSKFFMQSIKNNLIYQNPVFYFNGSLRRIRMHDLTNLLNNQSIGSFTEGEDETFLLKREDINPNHPSNRFTNQVDRINFLYQYRKIIKEYSRDYLDILGTPLDSKYQSKVFILGYKVEKYYLNDATLPVQTYYISHEGQGLEFFDTQMKYGDKYIYKIFHLVGVLGSHYKYSDLLVSNELGILSGEAGTVSEPGDSDSTKKYRARVQVDIYPSFQVLEIPVLEKEVLFYDHPVLPPEVLFYNERGKKNDLLMLFRANLNSSYDLEHEFEPLTAKDQFVKEKLNLSKDPIYGTLFDRTYFTGRYEIYRMDTVPQNISDFANNFLTEVDQDAELLFKNTANQVITTQAGSGYNFLQNNSNASYKDIILPNKKYYYLFRALTYHGTPSNHTPIYEVQIVQDSNETKLQVREYKIPKPQTSVCTKSAKRIIKITPNFEQLMFREQHEEESDDLLSSTNKIGTLSDHLLNGGDIGKKFKIRITSRHTGKKMDINLTFKLKKSNFPE